MHIALVDQHVRTGAKLGPASIWLKIRGLMLSIGGDSWVLRGLKKKCMLDSVIGESAKADLGTLLVE